MRQRLVALMLAAPLSAVVAQQPEVFERVEVPVGGASFYRFVHFVDLDADGRPDLLDAHRSLDALDAALGLGGLAFAPTQQTDVGGDAGKLVVGHVNGDAFADAAVAVGPYPATLHVLLGDGTGTFTPAGGAAPLAAVADMKLADLTGDGADDLLVVDAQPTLSNVLVFPADGAGGLLPELMTPVPIVGSSLHVGDIFEDGLPDVLVGNLTTACTGSNVTYVVLIGDGQGGLGPWSSACLGAGLGAAGLADLDGDGHLDLLVSGGPAKGFLGAGDGGFGAPIPVGISSSQPQAADLTGDGVLDVYGPLSKLGTVMAPGIGGGAFGPVRTSPLLNVGALADLDGDGLPDAAAANFSADATVVALNRGDGTFESALVSQVSSNQVIDVALGDFDGDGLGDVAQPAFPTLSPYVAVAFGRGDGSFANSSTWASGASPAHAVSAGDATGDGVDDVLALNGNGQAHLLVSQGDGTFAPPIKFVAPPSVLSVAFDGQAADVNGDGLSDLLECGAPGTVLVRLALAAGGWQAASVYPAPVTPDQLVTADFDLDGQLDVLASDSMYFNVGHGLFAPAQPLLVGSLFDAVASADFDEDGLPDVAAIRVDFEVPAAVGVFLGAGAGAFHEPSWLPIKASGGDLGSADFDRDGHVDLLAGSPSFELSLMRGDGMGDFDARAFSLPLKPCCSSNPAFALGDVNKDGWADVVASSEYGVVTLINQLGVWHDLGYAFSKSDGVAAQLSGGGPLQAGSPVVVHLGAAGPGADVALVIGVAQDLLPFKGGVMVPSFDVLVTGLVADAEGHVVLGATLPVALPSGTELFLQAFVADAGAPAGIAPSNALAARAP